jgi:hypothetical protein
LLKSGIIAPPLLFAPFFFPEYCYIKSKEKLMPQIQTMTLDEKLAISNKA